MNKKMKYLLKNLSILTIGEIITKLITFSLIPMYTHVLTTEQYGIVDLILAISLFFSPIVMISIHEAILRYSLDDKVDYNTILSLGLLIFIIGTVFSLTMIPIIYNINIIKEYRWYMYFYITLYSLKSIVLACLKGQNKLKEFAITNILNALFIGIFNIIFVVILNGSVKEILLSYILSELISILYAILFGKIYKPCKKIELNKALSKSIIKFSLLSVPNAILWSIIDSSDRIMVTFMTNTSQNGLLAIAYKLPTILSLINTVLIQAWRLSAIKENQKKENKQFTNTVFNNFIVINVLISALLLLIIKPSTLILFSKEYYNSFYGSCFLIIGFFLLGLSMFIGTSYYVNKNMMYNTISSLIAFITNVILNFLLIPKFGFIGAAAASTMCYLVLLIYRYFNTKKYQTINLFNLKNIMMFILLIIMLIGNFINNIIGNIVLLISFIIICILNYKFVLSNISKLIKHKK